MEEIKIPEEFLNVLKTSASFYKVPSPLEDYDYSDNLIRCSIIITESNDLVELQNEAVNRIERLNFKGTPSKVIIHNEYDPFRQYICILTTENTMHLLDYKNLKVINVWHDVEKMSSDDVNNEGRPSLYITRSFGDVYTVSEGDFLVERSSTENRTGKLEAVTALNNKLKSIAFSVESLRAEKIQKERLISQKVSMIQDQLCHSESYIKDTATGTSSIIQGPTTSLGPPVAPKDPGKGPILRILSARHRIVHHKWVICIAVINESKRYLVRNLDLVLHTGKLLNSLHYGTRILRISNKPLKKSNVSSDAEFSVQIDSLSPPILKPSKRAFVLAICDLPDFSSVEDVSCDGIISFQIRSLNPISNDDSVQSETRMKQVSFPSVQLCASNLGSLSVDVKGQEHKAGVSLDVVSLVAASVCHEMTINSLVTPLEQFVETVNQDQRIYKVHYLSNFYCFHIPGCAPLHLSSFILRPLSAHKILFTTYTKDENQGVILIHNLKELLPRDAFISSVNESCQTVMSHQIDLLPKMQLAIDEILNVYEGQEN